MMKRSPWLWIVLVSQASQSFSWQQTPLGFHRDPYEIYTYDNHPCRRPCREDTPNQTCRYYFLLEHYSTMSKECSACPRNPSHCSLPHCIPGSGVVRGLLTVNRMLPGPLISVCAGDRIEVMVDNKLELGEGTSIHWHGVQQRGSQFMDGTNLVTQCPVHAGSKMLYNFRADDVGTHFWHAHSAIQRSGGVFGGLVIRPAQSRDGHASLYDHDLAQHVILLTDWPSRPVGESFSRNFFDKPVDPEAILVNGVGRTSHGPATPFPVFRVTAGQRYRFRLISNGVMNCPITVSMDGHRLLVIATDGQDVRPVAVDSMVIYGGERFDFVIGAKRRTRANFWIRFRGQGRCEEARVFQAAILRYHGAPEEEPFPPATFNNTVMGYKTLNDAMTPRSPNHLQIVDLKNLDQNRRDQHLLTGIPDKQFYIAMGSSQLATPRFHPSYPDVTSRMAVSNPEGPPIPGAWTSERPQGVMTSSAERNQSTRPIVYHFNYILSILPPSPPLSQYQDIPRNLFCNNATVTEDCTRTVCECVHRLQVGLEDLVEMLLIGFKPGPTHPIHMHGHAFRVVAMMAFRHPVTVAEIRRMDQRGEISRKMSDAPWKDTVMVPSPGLTVIRFRASNPGFWLFHCHVDFHAETGMSLIVQSGHLQDMPKPPPRFPRCGDWLPGNELHLQRFDQDDSRFDLDKQWPPVPFKASGHASLNSRQRLAFVDTKMSDKSFGIQTESKVFLEVSPSAVIPTNPLKSRTADDNIPNILKKPQTQTLSFPPTKGTGLSLKKTTSEEKLLTSHNHLHGNEHQSKSASSKPQTSFSLPTTETQKPMTSSSPNSTSDNRPALLFMTSVFIGLVLVVLIAATYARRGRGCWDRREALRGQIGGYLGNRTGPSRHATIKTNLILDKKPADYLSVMATSLHGEQNRKSP